MRFPLLLLTTSLALAACTPAKEQAAEECAKQAKTLPSNVDGEEFCECLTAKIPDDASISEAEDILTSEASTCISDQISNMLKDMTPPTSQAKPTGE